jgi:hypothetical protein
MSAWTYSTCNHCDARIVWARTDHSRMPVVAEPSDRGNVLLHRSVAALAEPVAHVLGTAVAAAGARAAGDSTYLHHAVTCPYAPAWNRNAGAAVVAATAVAHEGDEPLPLFDLELEPRRPVFRR